MERRFDHSSYVAGFQQDHAVARYFRFWHETDVDFPKPSHRMHELALSRGEVIAEMVHPRGILPYYCTEYLSHYLIVPRAFRYPLICGRGLTPGTICHTIPST